MLRQRSRSAIGYSGISTTKRGPANYSPAEQPANYVNSVPEFLFNNETSQDGIHPGWEKGIGDTGGMFQLIGSSWENLSPATFHGHQHNAEDWYDWSGNCVPKSYYEYSLQSSSGSKPGAALSDYDVIARGTTGMSRSIPTNPSYGLSRAIGELRNDGLPAVVGMQALKERSKYLKDLKKSSKYSTSRSQAFKRKTSRSRANFRQSGQEYLNVEFGWLPLISDLLGFARAVKSSNKTIRQYQHSADSKIRRRYAFPVELTSFTGVGGQAFMTVNPVGGLWPASLSITSRHETSFSGAFRYHLPLGDDISSKMMKWESEANKLLGLRLTPKLVWDLAPWTWAYSWFSNTGDVLNNLSRLGADGLVLQYGYVTDYRKTSYTIDAWADYYGKRLTASSTYAEKFIRRMPATWYGFGFDFSALSSTQEAVVVALGLSHGLR